MIPIRSRAAAVAVSLLASGFAHAQQGVLPIGRALAQVNWTDAGGEPFAPLEATVPREWWADEAPSPSDRYVPLDDTTGQGLSDRDGRFDGDVPRLARGREPIGRSAPTVVLDPSTLGEDAPSWQATAPQPDSWSATSGQHHAAVRDCGPFGLGWGRRSERCFDDFISPVTNPLFFEDPRTLTEARFLFFHQRFPGALTDNSMQFYGLQARLALSDRWSLIVNQSGLISSQIDEDDWGLGSGFADMSFGLKNNFYRDPVAGRLLSAGITFAAPVGTPRSLQGNGDGEFNFFLSGGTRIGSRMHWVSVAGLRQPTNQSEQDTIGYWSNHYDVRLPTRRPVYLFGETNWHHWYNSSGAGATPGPLADYPGVDLFNLPTEGVEGVDIVTQAIGMKLIPRRRVEAGVAYEIPLTRETGLLKSRWTADLILRY
ncbi:MAG: hypothetical protein EA381_12760 [Planctomycetaceae bacterium]|nr:MAG: hypothetical protein EA381_12760 [Planctomycetaceae bacterium]